MLRAETDLREQHSLYDSSVEWRVVPAGGLHEGERCQFRDDTSRYEVTVFVTGRTRHSTRTVR